MQQLCYKGRPHAGLEHMCWLAGGGWRRTGHNTSQTELAC
jgi:hypothetical protein